MVDGANAVTSKTRAREGGTNIARSVIEISRSVRYRDLTAQSLLDELDARPGLQDVDPGTDYAINARNLDYAATITVCSLDDPQDGLGDHNGPIAYCADSDVLAAGGTATDRNPDDYKRVRVTLRWTTRETGQSITQTSSIINPVGGLGPTVTGLIMETPTSPTADPLLIESDGEHRPLQGDDLHVRLAGDLVGERQGEGSGHRWPEDLVLRLGHHGPRHRRPDLLRLHLCDPGRRLRQPGSLGRAVREDGAAQPHAPAEAQRVRRRTQRQRNLRRPGLGDEPRVRCRRLPHLQR